MTRKRLRLGWFANFLVPAWKDPWSGDAGAEWMSGDFFVDMATSLDRAGFDVMMLEDSTFLSSNYAGTFEGELKHTVRGPKNDPMLLIPLLAAATSRLGLVGTMSTSFYPPFLLARLVATLDHLSRGRVGWNVVTSTGAAAAQNFGMEKLPPHDLRYDIATEFVEVVEALWSSWDEEAVVMERESGVYARSDRVHPIDHRGEHFQVRGPLNTLPPVQRRPLISQAGASPKGREFAARHADMIVASTKGVDAMREYRDEIRERARVNGRDPDSIKVMYMISPFVEETETLAQRRRAERLAVTDERAERQLVMMSEEIDYSRFDLDLPLPEVTTQGSQSSLAEFRRFAGSRSLREAAASTEFESIPLAGTPDRVAEEIDDVVAEVGGDGFLIFAGGGGKLTRRYIHQICDGLMPELRRRGLVREGHGSTLRERFAWD